MILCGDFNINFLDPTSRALGFESILKTFCLEGNIEFPTRITSTCQITIDNIFLDKISVQSKAYPFINGMSDHDDQLVELLDLTYTP